MKTHIMGVTSSLLIEILKQDGSNIQATREGIARLDAYTSWTLKPAK
jgi:hypothetical protein